MSVQNQAQFMATACPSKHHVVNWDMPLRDAGVHPNCNVGRVCVLGQESACPMAMLLSSYKESGLWDACDPKHRACYFGNPCSVTGEKLCSRVLYLAKHQHAYGACSASSGPDHLYCPAISDTERRWLFPSCSACDVLTEARGLVLIHRRMLDECAVDEAFTDADIKCIQKSLAGYMRAYEVRRGMHLQELRDQDQAAYELEMRYAGGEEALGPKTRHNSWWKKTAGRFIKAVSRLLCV